MFDPIEETIKQSLKKRDFLTFSKEGCPSEKELWDYLNGVIAKEVEEKIAEHVVQCDFCLDSLLLAQEVRPGIGFGPSASPSGELLGNVMALAKRRGSQKTHAKKQFWLFLSLLSIGISFFLPRYFFQCLILSVIFGLKWVFDTVTNRTLIVMYDALKQKSSKREDPSKRLELKDHE